MVKGPDKLESLRHAIAASGLDFATIKSHQELLQAAYNSGQKPTFKVLDTCRLDNGGILPATWPWFAAKKTLPQQRPHLVAFTPAAGAASRYYAPLFPLIEALDQGDTGAIMQALTTLRDLDALNWPLPGEIRQLVEHPESVATIGDRQRQQVREILNRSKALLPHGHGTFSFLKAKHWEHRALGCLDAEVYVTPVGQHPDFAAELDATKLPHLLLEQGVTLSSIRFLRNGEPYVDKDGAISIVPAGHGALAELFPRVKSVFAAAECLLIRTIDNVIGTDAATLQAATQFFDAHVFAWTQVRAIRSALQRQDLNQAAATARSLFHEAPTTLPSPLQADAEAILHKLSDARLRVLWEVQLLLFNTPSRLAASLDLPTLVKLYNRPLNVLGQVPTKGRDIGGTPCFVKHTLSYAADAALSGPKPSETLKICLELPHASDEDRRNFLADQTRATHFNPVFVIAEITADPFYYSKQNRDFWVLAEKSYAGQEVAYFETVLFELLGNSAFANTLFLEIPRILFNPHKTLDDAAVKTQLLWPDDAF